MYVLAAFALVLASPHLETGRALLQQKDPAGAATALEACLAETPGDIDCHWELGWARWLQGRWAEVVRHWEVVEKADPTRKGLADALAQARDQQALEGLLARGRAAAPATFSTKGEPQALLRLRAVGDLMIGSDFPEGYLPPDDGAGAFAAVSDWLRDADLTFGNLEGPLCDGGETTKCAPDAAPGSCYAFRSPSRYAQYYQEAGFDVLSTANNHAGDFGQACRVQTEQHLDAVGIRHSGRPGDIARLEIAGKKVAIIGFHTSEATHDVRDIGTARLLVRALAADHDLVVVSFHGGAEGSRALRVPAGTETFYGEDRGDLRAFAHAVIDEGADLVLGHGPHVLRGMELYRDRLIAYSLGNFATYGRFSLGGNLGVGVVLEVELAGDGRFAGGRLLATRQVGQGTVEKDPENRAFDLVRTLSEQDFPGSAVRVAQDGRLGR